MFTVPMIICFVWVTFWFSWIHVIVGLPTQAQINTMWDFGYVLDDGPGVSAYGETYQFRKRVV